MPDKTAGPGSPVDLSCGGHVDGVTELCPCGHPNTMHSVGTVAGVSANAICEVKGCLCSGLGNKPGQGRGWSTHGPIEYPGVQNV